MDLFWDIFEKSGNIEAYLGFKEYEKIENREFSMMNKDIKVGKDNNGGFGIYVQFKCLLKK